MSAISDPAAFLTLTLVSLMHMGYEPPRDRSLLSRRGVQRLPGAPPGMGGRLLGAAIGC
jgi:hypothetical protein